MHVHRCDEVHIRISVSSCKNFHSSWAWPGKVQFGHFFVEFWPLLTYVMETHRLKIQFPMILIIYLRPVCGSRFSLHSF